MTRPIQRLCPCPGERQDMLAYNDAAPVFSADEFENLLLYHLLPRIAPPRQCLHALHAVACVCRGWFVTVRTYITSYRSSREPLRMCAKNPHECADIASSTELQLWVRTVTPAWEVSPERAAQCHYPYPLCWRCARVLESGTLAFTLCSDPIINNELAMCRFWLNGIETSELLNSNGLLGINVMGIVGQTIGTDGLLKCAAVPHTTAGSAVLKLEDYPIGDGGGCNGKVGNAGDFCMVSVPLIRELATYQHRNPEKRCIHCLVVRPIVTFCTKHDIRRRNIDQDRECLNDDWQVMRMHTILGSMIGRATPNDRFCDISLCSSRRLN